MKQTDNAVCADFAARTEAEKKIYSRVLHLKQCAIMMATAFSQASQGYQKSINLMADIFDEMEDLEKRIKVIEDTLSGHSGGGKG